MILDGKKIAGEIYETLQEKIKAGPRPPKLAVILVGDNLASRTYIRQKEKFAQSIGMEFELHVFDVTVEESMLLAEIKHLNNDPYVSGYIVQLPLPAHIDPMVLTLAIDPKKDVDGFTPYTVGLVTIGKPNQLQPCTPKGILRIFEYYHISLSGKRVTIIGRSNIVGKPLALMCINAGATVTVCNSKTPDLGSYTKNSDIIICATGKPHLLTKDMVTPGSIIIDVGISYVDGKITGNADFESLETENMITPVPGGVGPMTVAMLLENTYLAHVGNQK